MSTHEDNPLPASTVGISYLFVSPGEVRSIVEKTGWTVSEVLESQGPGYAVILKKS